jgi:hypothetical protein
MVMRIPYPSRVVADAGSGGGVAAPQDVAGCSFGAQ